MADRSTKRASVQEDYFFEHSPLLSHMLSTLGRGLAVLGLFMPDEMADLLGVNYPYGCRDLSLIYSVSKINFKPF